MPSQTRLSLESAVVVSREQVSCEISSEVVILSLETGEYFGLNPVAARIWALLQQPCTVLGIRDALLSEYDVDEEECTTRVLDVLEEMMALRLVDVS